MAGSSARWSVSRAAVLVTGLTVFSVVLGFGRDVVMAAVFGAGAGLDAYLVVQGFVSLVLALFVDAVARSTTPVVAREAAQELGRCPGHPGFNVALTVTVVLISAGAVLTGIFMTPVITVIAPGFDAAQTELAASLTRVVLLATVFIAGTNMVASLVQGHGRFAWSALEGVPFNLVMITAAGLFGPRYGVSALAVGFVIGSAGRLLFQLPPVRALGTRIRPAVNLKDPAFLEIARLAPPMLVGTALTNVNTMVDRAVASTLGEGTITSLSYAWRLVHLPENLVIASLLVPLYPALGAAANNPVELRRLLSKGLSVAVTVLTPLCIVMVVAAEPIVGIAFGRGAFDDAQVAQTALALSWYAPALLVLGCRTVIVRASYALGDSRSPVAVAIVAMLVNVVGDLTLGFTMGITGIALATTLSFTVAAVGNGWLLHARHRGLDLASVGGLLVRCAGLSTVAVLAGLAALIGLDDAPTLVRLIAVTAAVGGVYLAGLFVFRAPERTVILDVLTSARRRRS